MPSDNVPVLDIPRLQMREILAGRWRCCWNCDNWQEHVGEAGSSQSQCRLFKVRPPTEVIVVGCRAWFASGIPF